MKLRLKPHGSNASCGGECRSPSAGAGTETEKRRGGADRRMTVVDRRCGVERRQKTAAAFSSTSREAWPRP